jgi:hypothetical protein
MSAFNARLRTLSDRQGSFEFVYRDEDADVACTTKARAKCHIEIGDRGRVERDETAPERR